MPIEYTNLYSHHVCRENLINFIVNLSKSKDLNNKYSYEECYRMYYNLCIQNEKDILNEWIDDCINSFKNQNKLIFNISTISDILLYMLSQKLKYNNSILDKQKFILILQNINNEIIKKRICFIYINKNRICNNIIKKIVLEY